MTPNDALRVIAPLVATLGSWDEATIGTWRDFIVAEAADLDTAHAATRALIRSHSRPGKPTPALWLDEYRTIRNRALVQNAAPALTQAPMRASEMVIPARAAALCRDSKWLDSIGMPPHDFTQHTHGDCPRCGRSAAFRIWKEAMAESERRFIEGHTELLDPADYALNVVDS
jgi:hypothetical protein